MRYGMEGNICIYMCACVPGFWNGVRGVGVGGGHVRV